MRDKDDIRTLGLRRKITNKLLEGGIYTINQLINLKYSEILELPGISKKSFKEIEDAIIRHNLKNSSEVDNKIYNELRKLTIDLFKESLNEIKDQIHGVIFRHTNDIRTVVLEQSRILEGMQHHKEPNGVINKISEKIPHFGDVIYDLYKKMENL